MRVRLIIAAVALLAIIGGVWAYTDWQRDDAKAIAEGASVKATVATTDKAEVIKNEVRKRPVSDASTARRLSNGTW